MVQTVRYSNGLPSHVTPFEYLTPILSSIQMFGVQMVTVFGIQMVGMLDYYGLITELFCPFLDHGLNI